MARKDIATDRFVSSHISSSGYTISIRMVFAMRINRDPGAFVFAAHQALGCPASFDAICRPASKAGGLGI